VPGISSVNPVEFVTFCEGNGAKKKEKGRVHEEGLTNLGEFLFEPMGPPVVNLVT